MVDVCFCVLPVAGALFVVWMESTPTAPVPGNVMVPQEDSDQF